MPALKSTVLIVLCIASLYGISQFVYNLQEKSALPFLATEGNHIVRMDTGEPVTLRGVTSDYFRYGFNNDYPDAYGGLATELSVLDRLASLTDINFVMLYLGRLDKTREDIAELDQYIEFANKHGLYVMLAPAGTGFIETNPNKKPKMDEEYWTHVGPEDLSLLMEFLAARYAYHPTVMYQPTAEPSLPDGEWNTRQEKIAAILRKHTPNLIVMSTPYYNNYSKLPILPLANIAYSVGGYVGKDDASPAERKIDHILGTADLHTNYPTIVTEFGGNYGGDFSSKKDLALFRELLLKIRERGESFSVYRLRSAFLNDGLALVDTNGHLTEKGAEFVEIFKK